MAWSAGWNSPITSSLVNSSAVTLFMTGTLTSFLYHVTVGRGDPRAEHLTRSDSRILGTETEDDGVDEKAGSTERVKRLCILAYYIKAGLCVDTKLKKYARLSGRPIVLNFMICQGSLEVNPSVFPITFNIINIRDYKTSFVKRSRQLVTICCKEF